jgi:UTP--glucose-1-phosphate uridylyltransferase
MIMEVTKAVITAAAPGQQKLPLQTLIDTDGKEKTLLELLIEEVLSAGIDNIAIVAQPDDVKSYGQAISEYNHLVTFVKQNKAYGYGYAMYCASEFVGSDPFLHLVGDHLYVHRGNDSSAKHLVEFASQRGCSVSAVQPTRESLIPNFGVIGGKRLQGMNDVYQVERVIEKPTPTLAEQELIVPGLRAGYYLCFFGMHVLNAKFLDILKDELKSNNKTTISTALNHLAQTEQYLALEKNDLRYDLGEKYGLLKAQLALALYGKDRDRILNEIADFFVTKDVIDH